MTRDPQTGKLAAKHVQSKQVVRDVTLKEAIEKATDGFPEYKLLKIMNLGAEWAITLTVKDYEEREKPLGVVGTGLVTIVNKTSGEYYHTLPVAYLDYVDEKRIEPKKVDLSKVLL